MDAHPVTKETVARAIDRIRSIHGVIACALVTKTGIMMGKYFEEGGESARLVGVISTPNPGPPQPHARTKTTTGRHPPKNV